MTIFPRAQESRFVTSRGDRQFFVGQLSPAEVRDYGDAQAFGRDSVELSAAMRPRWSISGRTANTIVVAAIASDRQPACWACFSRSDVNGRVWHYGNLFTIPIYRRLGLSQSVVEQGVAAVQRLGGTSVCCFVSDRNQASAKSHERLGFAPTGFVKSILRSDAIAKDAVQLNALRPMQPVAAKAIREAVLSALAAEQSATAKAVASVLLRQLLPHGSFLPWRESLQQACQVALPADAKIYVRLGGGSASAWARGTFIEDYMRRALNSALSSLVHVAHGTPLSVFHDATLQATLADISTDAFQLLVRNTGSARR